MRAQRAIALEYHDVVPEHDFANSGFPGNAAASYKLSVERFAEHLVVLAPLSDRMIPLTPDPLFGATALDGLVLTFDDGGIGAIEHTAPMLESCGLRGVFFITTDRIDTRGFLTTTHIVELHRRGHCIGSHSRSHPMRMSALSRDELAHEWRGSLGRLSTIIGRPVTTASVPGGYYSRAVAVAAADAGIRVLFTSEPTRRIAYEGACAVVGRYTLRRSDSARRVAAIVGAAPTARWRQWLQWNAKKVLKRAGWRVYLRLRNLVFGER